jgi:16S rRNA (guanine527-N7)-methyltransferase
MFRVKRVAHKRRGRSPSLEARIEELVALRRLPGGSDRRIATLVELLVADSTAPTATADPAGALDVHFADSLTALDIAGFAGLGSVVDIGSGAGFPGLALALAMPRASFDLLESVKRRCAFIERALAAVEVSNARAVCARAENWGTGAARETYDGAVVRAVGPLPTLVEYAAPLLRQDGLLVAWKGGRDIDDERAAERAGALVGMRPISVAHVAGSAQRHLHVFEKVAPCPPGYPRRPGAARKRPLGVR